MAAARVLRPSLLSTSSPLRPAVHQIPLLRPRLTAAAAAFFSTTTDKDSVLNIQQVPAPGSGHIRVLLLNRPEARNALSRQLLDSLARQVDAIAAEGGNGPTRALIVASNVNEAFCAGADLKERVGMTKEEYVYPHTQYMSR